MPKNCDFATFGRLRNSSKALPPNPYEKIVQVVMGIGMFRKRTLMHRQFKLGSQSLILPSVKIEVSLIECSFLRTSRLLHDQIVDPWQPINIMKIDQIGLKNS